MKVENYLIDDPKRQTTTPFVRTFWNDGCGSEGCHCSDGWIISVSDGKQGLKVTFADEAEMKSYLQIK
jgi:hypothetical protein